MPSRPRHLRTRKREPMCGSDMAEVTDSKI